MSLVKFIKGTQAEIDATPIVDGQLLFQIDAGNNGKIYHDNGETRHIVGGKTDVYDGLDSNSATEALSAKQGKTLNTSVATVNSNLYNLSQNLENRGLGQTGNVKYLQTIQSVDTLRLSGTGIYLATVADASSPGAGFWYFEVNRYAIDTAKIIAREYLGTRIRETYWQSGTWKGWTDLVKATFDGTTLNITM